MKEETQKYKFLDDRPVENDRIGHYQIIAEQLYNTVHCNLRKPFVIGLFGSWGTGKSSIIEMLRKRCERDKAENTHVIIVDAWRKDKDIFNRQFLKKIAKELFEKKDYEAVSKAIDVRTFDNTSSWKPSSVAWILFVIFVLLFIGCIAAAIWGWHATDDDNTNPFPYVALISPTVGILIAFYFQFLLPRFSIKTDTKCEDKSVHDIDHFRNIYFEQIIGKAKHDCICIVIDNLDRVEPGDAISIIRVLKTFIVDAKEDRSTQSQIAKSRLDKVCFIIPCCDEELKKIINKEQHNKEGTDFLEKFFNVSFRIPAFRQQDAFQYAKDLLKEMELDFTEEHKSTICHIISEVYGKNPRKAKSFLNDFLLYYNVARACENSGKIEKEIITAHPDWLAIHMAHESSGSYYIQQMKSEISAPCKIALAYLKKPNDFDRIEGFADLYRNACQNNAVAFSEVLSKRINESRDIISAIWRNINHDDEKSRLNTIAATMRAIEENSQIQLAEPVKIQMAFVLRLKYPAELPILSGQRVYEHILRDSPKDIIEVIEHLQNNVSGKQCSEPQIQYCFDLLQAVLEDINRIYTCCAAHEIQKLKEEISKAMDRLVDSNRNIALIGLNHSEFLSNKIYSVALNMFEKGDENIEPERIVRCCQALAHTMGGNAHSMIAEVMKKTNSALQSISANRPESIVRCIKAVSILLKYAYESKMNENFSIAIINTFSSIFDRMQDQAKIEIMSVFTTYDAYTEWSNARSASMNQFKQKGTWILCSGTEKLVCNFIEMKMYVRKFLLGHINNAANRFESVCHKLLSDYEDMRADITCNVWVNRNAWIKSWIKENSTKLEPAEKVIIQKALFSIASGNQYPLDVYEALSYIKIGNNKKAVDERICHFDMVIKAKPLTIADGLYFALERVDKANFETSDAQNIILRKGWLAIDQSTAPKELKLLASKLIRVDN